MSVKHHKNPQDISGNIIRVTINFPNDLYNYIKSLAESEKRSFSNMTIMILYGNIMDEVYDKCLEKKDDTKSSLSDE